MKIFDPLKLPQVSKSEQKISNFHDDDDGFRPKQRILLLKLKRTLKFLTASFSLTSLVKKRYNCVSEKFSEERFCGLALIHCAYIQVIL